MKKIVSILALSSLLLISCKKNNFDGTSWLVTRSYPIPPDSGNSIYDGLTLQFYDNSVVAGDIYIDKEMNFNLQVQSDRIIVDDSIILKIVNKYEDSLILDFSDRARIKLIRLKNQDDEQISLSGNNWILKFDNPEYTEYDSKLILTDSTFFEVPNSRMAIKKNLKTNQYDRLIEKWNFKNLNGTKVLAITNGQGFDSFFRVVNRPHDSILNLECLNCRKFITAKLIRENNFDDWKRKSLEDKLSNSKWTINSIIDIDTIFTGSIPDTLLIPSNSITDKKLTFLFFDDHTYQVQGHRDIKRSGNWRLSSSGKEIVLNDGKLTTDFIDIISVGEDLLEIGHLNWFKSSDSYEDLELFYKVQLKKNNGG